MLNSLKKSFDIIRENPFVTLYFVLYLIVLFLIIPILIAGRNIFISMILSALILLLTCAFISGWFNMIKTSIALHKADKSPEEKLEEGIKLKNDFFCGVSEYILPVITGAVVVTALFYLHSYISDLIFGKIDSIIYELGKYANDTEALKNYFSTLPNSTWDLIFKKSLFSYVICSFITLFFLYWGASLYLNNNCSKNPFAAIIDAVCFMFKNFFQTFIVFVILLVTNFALMTLQALFVQNVIISFITMILRIYFAAYMIVLIFDLYEQNKPICAQITDNSDNGADSVGENCPLD